MASLQTFMTNLLGMWTQADRTSRRTALEELFHPDAHFYDMDGEFVGYEGLEDKISRLYAFVERPDEE
jgi:hypothetical protein